MLEISGPNPDSKVALSGMSKTSRLPHVAILSDSQVVSGTMHFNERMAVGNMSHV